MKRRLSASYTVEAAFILPICTAVILLLISETLFYRDIVVAERIAKDAAESGTRYVLFDAALGRADLDYAHFLENGILKKLQKSGRYRDERAIEEFADSLMADRLWFAHAGSATAEVNGDDVSVTFSVSGPDAVRAFFSPGSGGLFNRTVTVTVRGRNVAGAARLCTAAWETGERIQGFSDFLTKIKSLIGKLTG